MRYLTRSDSPVPDIALVIGIAGHGKDQTLQLKTPSSFVSASIISLLTTSASVVAEPVPFVCELDFRTRRDITLTFEVDVESGIISVFRSVAFTRSSDPSAPVLQEPA
jgi:hypothetical protein